ncbi:MAG: nucleoside-diphosphate sugar epimerase/dehydratase, partial [Sedimentibacter sp.]
RGIEMTIYLKTYNFLHKYRRHIPLVIDFCIAMVSYITSFAISGLNQIKIDIIKNTVLIYTVIYVGTFIILKVYKNMWRYTGVIDLCFCLISSILANIFFCFFTKALKIDIDVYVYPVAASISSLLSITARLVYRSLLIIGRESNKNLSGNDVTNVMIVGAGQATYIMLNEIKTNNHNKYNVKCIIDDDATKIGRNIERVPIAGNTNTIIEMVKKYDIEVIIISMPSIDKENKKRILTICANTQCKLKFLPEIYSLIDNKNSKDLISKLRDVLVEDLLGREPIEIDCHLTKEYIKNKVVLVTGGGGSIGSELCRQIASYSPKNLIILDIYENNAYDIQQELIRDYGNKLNMEVQIASVRDKGKLEQIFSVKNIDIVFHAAAHKHVPLMENNPEEAIKNNVIGTYNIVFMANKYKVQKFVLISTDKAVNPTNIMGATKRVCEMIVQAFNQHSKTDFVAVRFGNVLGSNGSVIPLFMEQIKIGGPVTVTHEEITRYFMTIPEAVQLVLRASVIANGGEIFVLDMGEPVKIKDLAKDLIKLAGLVPDKDIKIVYTGLRPGEKLYEELLITKDSGQIKTEIDKIFVEKPMKLNESHLIEMIIKLQKAAFEMDEEAELKLIEDLVPTYKITPNNATEQSDYVTEQVNTECENETSIVDNEALLRVLNSETA